MKTPKRISTSCRRLAATVLVSGLLSFPASSSAAQGDCSQPVSNGAVPVATDCLFILNVAVGLQTCSPECICAPSGTLPAKATDALLCLSASVGAPVTLDCPCGPVSSLGDDFNDNVRDNLRWGEATSTGNGNLSETSQHLEYTCSLGASIDSAEWEWIATALPLDRDWDVQIDLTNQTVPSAVDQVNSFGFGVYNPADWGDDLYAEMYASSLQGPPARNGFYAEMYTDNVVSGDADSLAIETTTGAVRILFDAASKVIDTQYDTDPSDGYQWSTYGTFGIAGSGGANGNGDWGLTPSNFVQVYVYGFSVSMEIDAGKMWGDNFLVTGGVPFP
jgi:hypothetical protein